MSQAQALGAASNDADANAGQGNVGEPVSSCQADAALTPTPEPTPSPTPLSALWVRLDLTQEEAASEPGSLRLHDATGGYNKTLAIAGNFYANPAPDNTVDVLFANVPTESNYSLTYIGGDGSETTIVEDAPFNSLDDNSLPTQENDASVTTPEEQP